MTHLKHSGLLLRSTALAFALAVAPVSMDFVSGGSFLSGARADSEGGGHSSGAEHQSKGGHGGSHKGGGGGQKGAYTGGQMHGKGGAGGSGSSHVPGADTTSTSDPDSDRRGPKYKGGGAGSGGDTGGKPVWAQEGIPEVELGRLNMGRAPDQVLNRQLLEAQTTFTAEMQDYYNLPMAELLDKLKDPVAFDAIVRIDSPGQNLALYKDLILNNKTSLDVAVPTDVAKFSAIFLGTASDKEISISADSVKAINAILGLPVPEGQDAVDQAVAADAVREAILTGHGS